jgi:4-amino-4-deoxy-L-arabinose transferase-like glycosyltransferase
LEKEKIMPRFSLAPVWQSWQAWWRNQFTSEQWRVLGVALATVIGASYRLVNLRDSIQFLADQGRDAIIAYEILHANITFVGPSTSVGDMYLGPLYYYFMAPFIFLAGNDPIGPVLAVVLLGVFTIPALYWVGRRLVGPWPAFFATLLYASAPYAIEYTRFSWNPNPAPLVTLAILYCIWKAWTGSARWWLGGVVSFLVMIQLHYVALLIAAPLGFFWFADIVRAYRNKQFSRLKELVLYIPLAMIMAVLSFLPLIVFNWRFDNVILKGFMDFLDGDPGASPRGLHDIFRAVPDRASLILFEIWGKISGSWKDSILFWLSGLYVLIAVCGWFVFRRTRFNLGYLVLVISVLTSALGLAYYRGAVHAHYYTYFYPISYLVTGTVLYTLAKSFRWLGVMVAASLFLGIHWLQVQPSQLQYMEDLGWKMSDMKATADRILAVVPEDKTYAMTTLSEIQDYRGLNYRYFLLTSDHPPIPLEDFGAADMLVIIAENPTDADKVLGSPVYEVVTFPKGEYQVYPPETIGPHIYVVERQ